MFAHVCTYVFHMYTHVCSNRTRGVPGGHIFVFQWYTYVCPKCTHMCALIARVCVPGEHMCVLIGRVLLCSK